MSKAAKALNLNIDENELKQCFKQFDEEIKFEEFKKIILGDEEKEEKFDKESTKVRFTVTNKINSSNNRLFQPRAFSKK